MTAKSPEPAIVEVAAVPRVAGPTAAEIAREVRRKRARKLTRGLLLWVGLPTLLATVYFAGIAHDEFESIATLVFTGPSDAVEQDATMLREHALSRDMLATLDARAQFSERYERGGDVFSRLPTQAGSETRYAFYRRHVDAQYDTSGRVFTLRVRAFSGAEAQAFARVILDSGRAFLSQGKPHTQAFVVVAAPSAPNEATHPQRGYGILTALFTSLALFGVGSLLIAAVREHGQF